jgi:two-component system sensor histidine kinase UhpB
MKADPTTHHLRCTEQEEFMNQTLRVLIVEDSADDVTLLLHTLRSGGYEVVHSVVDTPDAMRAALESQDWDVITSDHAMPHFSAPAALALAKELHHRIRRN